MNPKSLYRFLPYVIGIFAFLGFLDATYLTILHYKNAIPPCTIHGCEIVLTSKFSVVFGIPIALVGTIFYLAILVLVGILLTVIPAKAGIYTNKDSGSRVKPGMKCIPTLLLFLFTGAGLLVGIFLVFLQAFILHAFCQYCLASEVIDFLLFVSSFWLWKKSA